MNDSLNGVPVNLATGHFETGLFTLTNFHSGWDSFFATLILIIGISIGIVLFISLFGKKKDEIIVTNTEKPKGGPPKC